MAGLRRTWDKDRYEQLAKERYDRGDEDEAPQSSSSNNASKRQTKEEFLSASKTESGPMGSHRAFLKERQAGIDLESKVGKTELIAPTDAGQVRAAGFWCEVCSCLLKDSSSYLDHINGRKRKWCTSLVFAFGVILLLTIILHHTRSKNVGLQHANRASRCNKSKREVV